MNGSFCSCNSCKRLVPSRLHECGIRFRNFESCNLNVNGWKRLVPSRLYKLHDSKFPFVSRIEFIRSKHFNFSAHVSGVADWQAEPTILHAIPHPLSHRTDPTPAIPPYRSHTRYPTGPIPHPLSHRTDPTPAIPPYRSHTRYPTGPISHPLSHRTDPTPAIPAYRSHTRYPTVPIPHPLSHRTDPTPAIPPDRSHTRYPTVPIPHPLSHRTDPTPAIPPDRSHTRYPTGPIPHPLSHRTDPTPAIPPYRAACHGRRSTEHISDTGSCRESKAAKITTATVASWAANIHSRLPAIVELRRTDNGEPVPSLAFSVTVLPLSIYCPVPICR